jgi:hypothetical protein
MRRVVSSGLRAVAFGVVAASGPACGPVGKVHSGGAPVAWSISRSDSPTDGPTTVCEGVEPTTCVLDRTTDATPSYATSVLHVWGPQTTAFTGSLFIGYLHDPDPRQYKSNVALTSNGQDVHHRVFSRVTTVPGQYEVRVRLEETGPHLEQPRVHDLTIPVIVK